jgi:Phosphotransferase enzyme family
VLHADERTIRFAWTVDGVESTMQFELAEDEGRTFWSLAIAILAGSIRPDRPCRRVQLPFRHTGVVEIRLDGGDAGGAVRVGDTVRRATGPWTPAVHAVLAHLAGKGFAGSPRPLGLDAQGREVLTFLAGETVGSTRPWPQWVHADDTLTQVARWMRGFHRAVTDFVPPADAVWRMGGQWAPGLIVGHNDAAPYNAVWRDGRLAGFFDWDMAGPVSPASDVAYAAFSWVPLHARHVVAAEGFTDFEDRPRRLRLFLAAYGWTDSMPVFLAVVTARIQAHVMSLRDLATRDSLFARIVAQGGADDLETALAELEHFT